MLLSVFLTVCAIGISVSKGKVCHLVSLSYHGRLMWALESEISSECTKITIGGHSSLENLQANLLLFEKPNRLLTSGEDVQNVLKTMRKHAIVFSKLLDTVINDEGSFQCPCMNLAPMNPYINGTANSFLHARPQCPLLLEYNTDTTYRYRYREIPVDSRCIDFEVKANHNVHIALSPSNSSSSNFYEIVIGGWNNTKSVIRLCEQCEEQTNVNTAQYLSGNEFRRFWITFGIGGAIAVGRDNKTTPFMEWTDPAPLDIHYLGYSTGFESSGEFRFYCVC